MPFVPNRPRSELPARGVPQDLVAWPFVDELFDYETFLAPGTIGTLPQEKWGTPVAVIGAGPAGMAAAFELLKVGAKPVIFEASNRIGGRNWSCPFTEGGNPTDVFAEMGAMRVPTENKVFYSYAGQFGMQFTTFPDPGQVPTLLYYENQAYPWAPKAPAPGPFADIATEFNNFAGALTKPFNEPWSQTPPDWAQIRQLWQRMIARFKDTSFYEALVEGIPEWGTEQLNAFGALGMGSGGFGPLYGVGFLELLRILLNQFETDQQLMLNGISGLTDGFYETQVTLPSGQKASLQQLGTLRLNTEIESITWSQISKNPTVTWNGGSLEFAAVIVATTTRAMEFMRLTPALPQDETNSLVEPEVKSAIRNLHLMESSKMFVRTATKFWKDGSTPQVILTDELPRAAYCLDYSWTDNGVVLISYTWGDDSAKLLGLPPAQRFAVLKDTLAVIDRPFADALVPVGGDEGILNVDWEAEPGYYGAFKLNDPGQDEYVRAAYFQFQSALGNFDRGVYLAGDSVSWAGGWTEGALHTGLNAAAAVVERLGGAPNSPSPLDIPADQYVYAD